MSKVMTLHLGCGENIRADAWNVDYVDLDGVDEVVDLEERPWPWADGRWQCIVAEHVFEHLDDIEAVLRECGRILAPGGQLVTRWPVGTDARTDDDHEREWLWGTPETYCGARHWDSDVGLSVVSKDVSLTSVRPGPWHYWDRLRYWIERQFHGAGQWCFAETGARGEFTVVFEA